MSGHFDDEDLADTLHPAPSPHRFRAAVLYTNRLMSYPDCSHPQHPGCVHCQDDFSDEANDIPSNIIKGLDV